MAPPAWLLLAPLRKVMIVPALGIGMIFLAGFVGAADMTVKTARVFVGSPQGAARKKRTGLVSTAAALAVSGAIVGANEFLRRPAAVPPPALPVGPEVALAVRLRNIASVWTHYVRHYPYAFRFQSVFLAGLAAGIAFVVAENAYNRRDAPDAGAATAPAVAVPVVVATPVVVDATEAAAPPKLPAAAAVERAAAASAPAHRTSAASAAAAAAKRAVDRLREEGDSGAIASDGHPIPGDREYTAETAAAAALLLARGVAEAAAAGGGQAGDGATDGSGSSGSAPTPAYDDDNQDQYPITAGGSRVVATRIGFTAGGSGGHGGVDSNHGSGHMG